MSTGTAAKTLQAAFRAVSIQAVPLAARALQPRCHRLLDEIGDAPPLEARPEQFEYLRALAPGQFTDVYEKRLERACIPSAIKQGSLLNVDSANLNWHITPDSVAANMPGRVETQLKLN